jgi:hypothetical protein
MPRFVLLSLALLALMVVSGCGHDKTGSNAGAGSAAAAAQSASATAEAKQPSESGAMHGSVLETMDAGSYTYVKVKTASGEVWAAGPTTVVAVGDEVALPQGMLMQDFESPSLGRKFPEIYFVNEIRKGGAAAVPPGHAGMPTGEPGAEHTGAVMGGKAVAAGSVARAEGGRTVAEIHAGRAGLGGQRVKVRGQVVKSTPGVMGRNWLHIQDGSADGPQGDLTVTTASADAKVGDLVLVEGVAAVDRDFGSGYRYEVLIEDARVTVEPR